MSFPSSLTDDFIELTSTIMGEESDTPPSGSTLLSPTATIAKLTTTTRTPHFQQDDYDPYTTDPEIYISLLELDCEKRGWDDSWKKHLLGKAAIQASRTKTGATDFWNEKLINKSLTYTDMKDEFIKFFRTMTYVKNKSSYERALRHSIQVGHIADYILEFLSNVRHAQMVRDSNHRARIDDDSLVNYFVGGIKDKLLKRHILLQQPKNWINVVTIIRDYEDAMGGHLDETNSDTDEDMSSDSDNEYDNEYRRRKRKTKKDLRKKEKETLRERKHRAKLASLGSFELDITPSKTHVIAPSAPVSPVKSVIQPTEERRGRTRSAERSTVDELSRSVSKLTEMFGDLSIKLASSLSNPGNRRQPSADGTPRNNRCFNCQRENCRSATCPNPSLCATCGGNHRTTRHQFVTNTAPKADF